MTDLTPKQQLRVCRLIWPWPELATTRHSMGRLEYWDGSAWMPIDLTSNEAVGAMALYVVTHGGNATNLFIALGYVTDGKGSDVLAHQVLELNASRRLLGMAAIDPECPSCWGRGCEECEYTGLEDGRHGEVAGDE